MVRPKRELRDAKRSAREGKVFDINTREEINPSNQMLDFQIEQTGLGLDSTQKDREQLREQLRQRQELRAQEPLRQWQAVQKFLIDDIEDRMKDLQNTGNVKRPAKGGGSKEYKEYQKLSKRLKTVKAGGKEGTEQIPLIKSVRGRELTPEQIKRNKDIQQRNELLAFATSFYNDEGLTSSEALSAAAAAPGNTSAAQCRKDSPPRCP